MLVAVLVAIPRLPRLVYLVMQRFVVLLRIKLMVFVRQLIVPQNVVLLGGVSL